MITYTQDDKRQAFRSGARCWIEDEFCEVPDSDYLQEIFHAGYRFAEIHVLMNMSQVEDWEMDYLIAEIDGIE